MFLNVTFFNIIPRTRELKISAAQFPQQRYGKWACCIKRDSPPWPWWERIRNKIIILVLFWWLSPETEDCSDLSFLNGNHFFNFQVVAQPGFFNPSHFLNSSDIGHSYVSVKLYKGGRRKKSRLLRGHVPYQGGGGGDLLPAKKVDFFQKKCKKYSACPENLFYWSIFFCIVTP